MPGPLDYSTTAGSNTTVGGVSIAEGMAPGNVNNGMRAMMADTRKWQLDWSGITTAGTGNAYTITSNQGITAYADGMRFSFRADRANTGAATLNVDGRGAKSIRRMDGSAAVALVSGDLIANGVYDVVYVLADDVFVVVNSFGTLPGLTATIAELNYMDGVTSAVQTQLNGIAALTTAAAPPGAVMHFAQSTAPTGWLAADGTAVSRATYANLFAAIGTTFGVGDGATTFKLPDLRGEFIRGLDDGRGVDAGRVFGSAQLDSFQNHGHIATTSDTRRDSAGPNQVTLDSTSGPTGGTRSDRILGATAYAGSVAGSPRVAAETRPRNVALLACIKH